LAAERHRTELVARQTGERLPAEQQTVLAKGAVGESEAVFQREDSLESATQIFRTTLVSNNVAMNIFDPFSCLAV
jgi:hypothetical protein